MQPNHKKNSFDWFVQEAIAAGLERDISLKEKITFQHGGWRGIDTYGDEVGGVANVHKLAQIMQLQQKHAKMCKKDDSFKSFKISMPLKKGIQLPPMSEEKMHLELAHKKGEILLIITWLFWRPYEDKLMQLAGRWKDKVRVVCVKFKDFYDQSFQMVQEKYSKFEHIDLGQGKKERLGTFQLLKFEEPPTVLLVNQAGVIDYLGHSSGINLDERIPQLVNQEPVEEAPINTIVSADTDTGPAGEQLWAKFHNRLQTPSRVRLKYTRTRTFKDGKTAISMKDLRFSYQPDGPKSELQSQEAVKKLTEGLEPSEYAVDVDIRDIAKNQEICLNSIYDQLQDILMRNGFKDMPVFKVINSINFMNYMEWDQSQSLRYPNIPYQGKTNFSMGKKVKEDYMDRYTQNTKLGTKEHLYEKYPFTLAGSTFAGIHGLFDYTTGAKRDIIAEEGVTHIICFERQGESLGSLEESIELYAQLLEKNNAFVHFIHPEKLESYRLNGDNIWDTIKRVKVYYATSWATNTKNDDVDVFERQSVGQMIIVNGFGTVVCRSVTKDVFASFHKPQLPRKNISEGFLKFLKNLPEEDVYNSVQAQIQKIDYPTVTASFIEEFSRNSNKSVGHTARLTVKIKSCHKTIVQPLLKIFEEEGEVTFMDIIELPEGTNCSDCKTLLKLPYYYFHVSKVHRCVDCAQRQDKEATDKLKRYPVSEHSVLIISDREVALQMLGRNLQPSTSKECIQGKFCCSGCSSNRDEARYICLGCPKDQEKGFVDFCQECAIKLRGTDEDAKRVIERQRRHEKKHALLRVQYNPQGYWQY